MSILSNLTVYTNGASSLVQNEVTALSSFQQLDTKNNL